MRDNRIEEESGKLPRLIALGPSALLARFLTAALGGILSLGILVAAIERIGQTWVVPLVATVLGTGVALRKVERLQTLALGWLVVGVALAAFIAGIYIAHWLGMLEGAPG